MDVWTQQLERWHDFYLLIGGASATLMGLTFVAVSLAPHLIVARLGTAVRAFVTPVVTYFASNVLVCAIMLMPQLLPSWLAVLLAVTGVSGIVYVIASNVHQLWHEYELGIDDWLFYCGLPVLGYAAIAASGIGCWFAWPWHLFATAAALLLFLVIGMRNTWDSMIAMAQQTQQPQQPQPPAESDKA